MIMMEFKILKNSHLNFFDNFWPIIFCGDKKYRVKKDYNKD
jgi:hypothetical protein